MAAPPIPQATHAGRVLSVKQSLLAMLGLAFVTMMVAIDQTVVGTALPTIAAELNGFHLYAWVATGYLLASVIAIPIFGRLGDFYGRKPFVVASIVVFTLASVFSGIADTMPQLVMARALQGVGGGMLVGTVFACVPDLFPDPHVRLRWQIMLSGAFGIANAFGPTLGGFLTQYVGWRWIFFINLPLGLLALFCVLRFLPHIRHNGDARVRLDWQGAILVVVGLSSLQFLVQLLPTHGLTLPMLALVLVCVAVFTLLIWWERRCPHPLIPLDMFSNPALCALFWLSAFLGFIFFVLMFYVPLLLQGGFGQSPRDVGMLITPMVVCITIGSVINARIVIKLPQPTHMLYAGFGLMALSCVGMITMWSETSRWLVLLYMVMAGSGLGFVMPNLTIFAQEITGRQLLGISTAMLQSVRMIGGMFGMAIVGTLVQHYYRDHVEAAFPQAKAEGWLTMLHDPQMLVSPQQQEEFTSVLHRLAVAAEPAIEAARHALAAAIHTGLLTVLIVALVSLAWVYRMPSITFRRRPAATPPEKPDA